MVDFSPERMMMAAAESAVNKPVKRGLPVMGKPSTPKTFPLGTSLLLCGPAKTGKSTAAATARMPLALDFERRLSDIDIPRLSPLYLSPPMMDEDGNEIPRDYPFDRTMSDMPKGKQFKFMTDWLVEVGKWIKADAGDTYQTLIFDTLDTLVQLLIQAHVYDNGISKDLRQDYRQVYSAFMPILTSFTDRLPIDTIYLCHVDGANVDGAPVLWLTLPPYVKEWIAHHVSAIGMMYAPTNQRINRIYWGSKTNWPTGKGLSRIPDETPANLAALYAAWRGDDPEEYQPTIDVPAAAASEGQAPQRKPKGK